MTKAAKKDTKNKFYDLKEKVYEVWVCPICKANNMQKRSLYPSNRTCCGCDRIFVFSPEEYAR